MADGRCPVCGTSELYVPHTDGFHTAWRQLLMNAQARMLHIVLTSGTRAIRSQ